MGCFFAKIAYFLGVLVFLRLFLTFSRAFYRHFLMKELDLAERYGKNSWAVITGGSEGIGRGLAIELAKRGFNLFLLSRSKEKLKEAEFKCYEANPKIQIRFKAVDFSKGFEEASFYEKLVADFADLDVSILVNNVGKNTTGFFGSHSTEEMKSMISINCGAICLMSKLMLPKMLQREKRSALINLSSVASVKPSVATYIYDATKIFDDFISRGLAAEYGNKIDSFSVKPGFVVTRFIAHLNPKKLVLCIDEEQCAKGALKMLGREKSAYPHWKHELLGRTSELSAFLGFDPTEWLQKDIVREAEENIKQGRTAW